MSVNIKNVVVLILLILAGWWLYKRL